MPAHPIRGAKLPATTAKLPLIGATYCDYKGESFTVLGVARYASRRDGCDVPELLAVCDRNHRGLLWCLPAAEWDTPVSAEEFAANGLLFDASAPPTSRYTLVRLPDTVTLPRTECASPRASASALVPLPAEFADFMSTVDTADTAGFRISGGRRITTGGSAGTRITTGGRNTTGSGSSGSSGGGNTDFDDLD